MRLAPFGRVDISLNELNDLAAAVAAGRWVQEAAFEGVFHGGAEKSKRQTRRICAWRSAQKPTAIMWWMPRMTPSLAASTRKMNLSLDGSNEVFEIGLHWKNDAMHLYVFGDGEPTTAPPVQKRCRESRDTSSRLTPDCIPTLAMRAR